jgi:nucleotide-binding universal stress UspA family protein
MSPSKDLKMKMKILIPTDFSKNAWNAIIYAADLFKDKECVFYLLNAHGSTAYSTSEMMVSEPGTLSYDTAKAKSEEGLAKVMSMLDFREKNHKHSYSTVSQFNDPLSAIHSVVEKRDIELVVMGTKGASDYENRLFGSNTVRVMEELRTCPILGIPLDARVVHLKEIVFPTSFKTHYKRRELTHLVELAQIQAATICVLHVSENQELDKEQKEDKELLEECLEGSSFTFHELGGSNVANGVQRFVESRNSDMVAFINRKHSFFNNIFSKPMVKELGMFSKVPLLVMHDLRN